MVSLQTVHLMRQNKKQVHQQAHSSEFKGIFHKDHLPATIGMFSFIIAFSMLSLQIALSPFTSILSIPNSKQGNKVAEVFQQELICQGIGCQNMISNSGFEDHYPGMDPWQRQTVDAGTTSTNTVVYPNSGSTANRAYSGSYYLAANCKVSGSDPVSNCQGNHIIFQEINVSGLGGKKITYGGYFASEIGEQPANIDIALWDVTNPNKAVLLQKNSFTTPALSDGISGANAYSKTEYSLTLPVTTTKVQYKIYLINNRTVRIDNQFLQLSQLSIEEVTCSNGGGTWKEFNNVALADKCTVSDVSSQVVGYACDCGEGKCWNGSSCVANCGNLTKRCNQDTNSIEVCYGGQWKVDQACGSDAVCQSTSGSYSCMPKCPANSPAYQCINDQASAYCSGTGAIVQVTMCSTNGMACNSTTGQCAAPTQPAANENQLCGGIDGVKCATGLTCIDDPDDTCDPAKGGRDCSGTCLNTQSPDYCGKENALRCLPSSTIVPQKCIKNKWTNQTACSAGATCNNGACLVSAAQTTCTNSGGTWGALPNSNLNTCGIDSISESDGRGLTGCSCPFSSKCYDSASGSCVDRQCTLGTNQCGLSSQVQTCHNGRWVDTTTCANGCSNGACVNSSCISYSDFVAKYEDYREKMIAGSYTNEEMADILNAIDFNGDDVINVFDYNIYYKNCRTQ